MNSAPEIFHYAGKLFIVICIWSLHMMGLGTEESYSGLYVGTSPPLFAQEQKLGNIIMEHVSLFLVKQSGTSSISFKKLSCSWSGGLFIHLIWEFAQHHFNLIGHRKLYFSEG